MSVFDVLVVGGGHAGSEAAAAAARMGAAVCLVTLDRRTIAQMPCNPAIGGVGKGHLVAEIDALGGIQGWAADRAGIQFRILNASRGPAVWGPRAQCDKARYSSKVRRVLEGLRGLEIIEDEVEHLDFSGERVRGVVLKSGATVRSRTVILTTGTFLGAILHTGEEQRAGGRFGERPSVTLARDLAENGLDLRRFKTGTPPRLDRESIDYSLIEEQLGDPVPRCFSFRTRAVANLASCWVTRTGDEVQQIIEENLHRSPLFSGVIDGVGPRYCPSIEDKVVRFPHHREHTVFVEPEGLASRSMYVNGLSTSLPTDVQQRVVRAVPGLADAEIIRFGYAVEYDIVAPGQVNSTLESRSVDGLFLAGQLLGTSGYEEAAGLGLLAGVNAVANVRGEEPLILGREEAYLGVMVDDLVKREHREPYRIFTSRAEHRLVLGADSARERLMEKGLRLGLIDERVFHVEHGRWQARARVREKLSGTTVNPDRATCAMVLRHSGIEMTAQTTWGRLLTRQDVDWRRLGAVVPDFSELEEEDQSIVVGLLRYDGYRERAERERARIRRLRGVAIPSSLVFADLPGLSLEIVEALQSARPRTLADAERVPGMTPAALSILAGRLSVPHDRDPR